MKKILLISIVALSMCGCRISDRDFKCYEQARAVCGEENVKFSNSYLTFVGNQWKCEHQCYDYSGFTEKKATVGRKSVEEFCRGDCRDEEKYYESCVDACVEVNTTTRAMENK